MFKDKVAVVTGGASGIGRAIGEALVRRSAKVAVADISGTQAEATARALGDNARGYRCDITKRDELAGLAEAVSRQLGPISYVFANAGVCISGSLAATDPSEFDWLLDVNVRGTFATIQVFAPFLEATAAAGGPAHLTLTGSEHSLGLPTVGAAGAYTATKHAIMALADAARRDWRDAGVGVSILCPGMVDTNLYNSRAHRQDDYGGASALPPEQFEKAKAFMAQGQDPGLTASLCLEGIERGEFLIIADPSIRRFAEVRAGEVAQALDIVDTRIAPA